MVHVDPSARAAFALLGLQPDADEGAVVAAYRRLARTTHPDLSAEHDAAERFTALAAAYRQAMEAVTEGTGPVDPPETPAPTRTSPRANPSAGPLLVAGPVHVVPAPGEEWRQEILWFGPLVRLGRGGRW